MSLIRTTDRALLEVDDDGRGFDTTAQNGPGQGLRNLRALNLHFTPVTDAGLEHLRALPALAVLDLGHTQVTDAGVRRLGSLKGLRELYLGDTQVIVFSVHGTVRASSAQPPHRSTTISPSMLTASEAPRSSPDSSLAANSSRRGSKRALHVPPSGVG